MSERKELELVGGASTRPTASEHFTKEAWRLLVREHGNSREAVEAIRARPGVLAEVQEKAEELQAAIAPCGDEAVRKALQPVAVVYGSPWEEGSLAEIALKRYFAVLSELPLEALLRGIEDYDRLPEGRFGFPKPGQLVELCRPHAVRLRTAAGRARLACERLPTRAAAKTAEERAREREELIAAGHLNPDGTFKPVSFKPRPMPEAPRTGETRAEMVERLRKIAGGEDPHLQELRQKPIPRRRDGETEFA